MFSPIRAKFVVIVLLTLLAASIAAPIPGKPKFLSGFQIHPGIDLAGGAELRYKVLFGPAFQGDRHQVTNLATDVLRRRLEAKHLKEPKISSYGDDEIVVQLAGIDADGLAEYKRLIGKMGKLELFAEAPQDLQERYAKDQVLPEGYRILKSGDRSPIMVRKEPVLEGRHIVHAEPHQDLMSGGGRWVTLFELDSEGAKRFDEAAEKLFHQQPPGRIVIMLDNEVHSAPVVRSPAFHGRGQISGAKE